jgi:hypothetical protein
MEEKSPESEFRVCWAEPRRPGNVFEGEKTQAARANARTPTLIFLMQ